MGWNEAQRDDCSCTDARQQALSLQDLKLKHSNDIAAASITPVSHLQYHWCLTFTFLFRSTHKAERVDTRLAHADRPLFHHL